MEETNSPELPTSTTKPAMPAKPLGPGSAMVPLSASQTPVRSVYVPVVTSSVPSCAFRMPSLVRLSGFSVMVPLLAVIMPAAWLSSTSPPAPSPSLPVMVLSTFTSTSPVVGGC